MPENIDNNTAAFVIHKNQTGAQKLCEDRCMVEGWSCTSNKAMKPDCSVGFVKRKTLALLAKGYFDFNFLISSASKATKWRQQMLYNSGGKVKCQNYLHQQQIYMFVGK